jgi:phosphatidylinositol alpha-1,6-mannosyltransferase
LRYLIITSEFPPGPGGIGKHAYCLANALTTKGIEVDVVCNMDYTTEEEISLFLGTLQKGVVVHRIKREGMQTYTNRIRTVFSLCDRYHFDKIIVSGQFSLWLGYLLKRRYKEGVKVEAFIHGSELFIGGRVKRYLTRKSLGVMDKLYPVSGYTARMLNKADAEAVKVIPNGLDTAEWANIDTVQPFNWKGQPNLLTVGSISERKGQINIVNALPEILKVYPNTHYHIVGKADNVEKFKSYIRNKGLENYVTVHGVLNKTDLKRAYKSADIFCLLSNHTAGGDFEGFGIAVLEANIMGIPAVGSKMSGIEDAIQQGYNGYLVNPTDASDVVEAIDKILKSSKESISQQCVSWANKFDWDNIVKEIL